MPIGVLAACLTPVSIFGGKLFSTQLIFERDLATDGDALRPMYDEMCVDAAEWATLDSTDDDAVRDFMVAYAYTEQSDAADIRRDELANFHEWSVPTLKWMASSEPRFADWRTDQIALMRAMVGQESMAAYVIDDLLPVDILLALLAIGSAFSLVNRQGAGAPIARAPSDKVDDSQSPRRAA